MKPRQSKVNLFLFSSMVFLVLSSAVCVPTVKDRPIEVGAISLPPGFRIEVFADNVTNARSMCWGDEGTLFVGTRSEDNLYAIQDTNGDFRADRVVTLFENMYSPNGVAFKDGSLYVAEINKVLRIDNIESRLDNPPNPVVVRDDLPNERHHGWKYIAFGPDGKLYVPVGAPCNICERLDDERFASILRMDPDGKNLEVFAHGVRNTVGFDWDPADQVLHFTDNGRDWLGDDQPNDELNRAPEKGQHFGYPYCHAGFISDPKFGEGKDCKDYTPPLRNLGPHVAALGMKFYTGKMFPKAYHNKIFIAEHGSWNRSTPIGYRVSVVDPHASDVPSYEVFAEGWLSGNSVTGRPVDLLQMPDGSMLLSDDAGNKIWRISYEK